MPPRPPPANQQPVVAITTAASALARSETPTSTLSAPLSSSSSPAPSPTVAKQQHATLTHHPSSGSTSTLGSSGNRLSRAKSRGGGSAHKASASAASSEASTVPWKREEGGSGRRRPRTKPPSAIREPSPTPSSNPSSSNLNVTASTCTTRSRSGSSPLLRSLQTPPPVPALSLQTPEPTSAAARDSSVSSSWPSLPERSASPTELGLSEREGTTTSSTTRVPSRRMSEGDETPRGTGPGGEHYSYDWRKLVNPIRGRPSNANHEEKGYFASLISSTPSTAPAPASATPSLNQQQQRQPPGSAVSARFQTPVPSRPSSPTRRSSLAYPELAAGGIGSNNEPSTPPPSTSRRKMPAFRIALPHREPFNQHIFSQHHSKTPGWSEPYSAPPFVPFNEAEEKAKRPLNERLVDWCLYSYWVPLLLRLANFSLTIATMSLGIRIRQKEMDLGADGIIGSSPVVAIIYSPITLIHIMGAVYFEYFGKPIGLWSLPSKLLFTSLDLLSISLWSSLLSLTLSDLLASPLQCVPPSSRWWTNIPPLEGEAAYAGVVHAGICGPQIALAVTVLVGTVGFLTVNAVSLARIFAKVVKGRSGAAAAAANGGAGGGYHLPFHLRR